MKVLRTLVVASLVVKIAVLGTWWAGNVRASSSAEAAPAAEASEAGTGSVDVMERSRGFRDVLAAVAARTKELDAREQALAAREAGLAALEATVAEQVARLESPAAPAAGGVRPAKAPGGRPAAKPASGAAAKAASPDGPAPEVTRVYELMKPDEAAPILDKLDDATLKIVLGRMKEKQVGALLAAMSRERAVAFTKMLADGAAGDDAAAGPSGTGR